VNGSGSRGARERDLGELTKELPEEEFPSSLLE